MTVGKKTYPEKLAEAVIWRRRDNQDLTQAQVAERGGPSTETLRLIEGARRQTYGPGTLLRLDRALGWRDGTSARFLDGTADDDEKRVVSFRSTGVGTLTGRGTLTADGTVNHPRTADDDAPAEDDASARVVPPRSAQDTARADDTASGGFVPLGKVTRPMLKAAGYDRASIDHIMEAKRAQGFIDQANRAVSTVFDQSTLDRMNAQVDQVNRALPGRVDVAALNRMNAQLDELNRWRATVGIPLPTLPDLDEDDEDVNPVELHAALPLVPTVALIADLIARLGQVQDRSDAADDALQSLYRLLPELFPPAQPRKPDEPDEYRPNSSDEGAE